MARKEMHFKESKAVNNRDIVVIGASAGGIGAMVKLLGMLPEDLPASIFVVIHISPDSPSMLPQILQRAGKLKTVEKVKDGELIKPGHVYVAPPDQHLMIEKGRLRLIRGPRENRHRPAIDPLFRSAARTYKSRVIGVILTGNLDDGSSGLLAVKACGGIALVQEPKDAEYPEMPRNALEQVKVDHQVTLTEMGALLTRLVGQRPKNGGRHPVPAYLEIETGITDMNIPGIRVEQLGKPSDFACPECHGVLWRVKEGGMERFRCRVGHAFSFESLRANISDALEASLWTAVRALEEKVGLLQRLAKEARQSRHLLTAHQFEERFRELEPAAKTIRAVLLKSGRRDEVENVRDEKTEGPRAAHKTRSRISSRPAPAMVLQKTNRRRRRA